MNITVEIPETVYRNAVLKAEKVNKGIDEFIVDSLEDDFSIKENFIENDISQWADEDVLALANLKVPEAQAERMSELADRRQDKGISKAEEAEFQIYLEIYNKTNFRKSCGLVESVKRGLIDSPKDLK